MGRGGDAMLLAPLPSLLLLSSLPSLLLSLLSSAYVGFHTAGMKPSAKPAPPAQHNRRATVRGSSCSGLDHNAQRSQALHALAAARCGDSACVCWHPQCMHALAATSQWQQKCMRALAATVQEYIDSHSAEAKSFGTAPCQAGSYKAASLRDEHKGSTRGQANLTGHSANGLPAAVQ